MGFDILIGYLNFINLIDNLFIDKDFELTRISNTQPFLVDNLVELFFENLNLGKISKFS
jgi:hypothetical protein